MAGDRECCGGHHAPVFLVFSGHEAHDGRPDFRAGWLERCHPSRGCQVLMIRVGHAMEESREAKYFPNSNFDGH